MRDIGANIRRLRELNDMTQSELAERLGKTRSAISQYENGVSMPRMGVIENMANVFGVSKSEILGETRSGTGSLSCNEEEIVAIMRTITPEGQRQLMIYARGIAQTYSKNNKVRSA